MRPGLIDDALCVSLNIANKEIELGDDNFQIQRTTPASFITLLPISRLGTDGKCRKS
jgi:hypothetical protein